MIKQLELQKQQLISYLLSKVTAEDWHACADAAMDLREIEARIETIELLQKKDVKNKITKS